MKNLLLFSTVVLFFPFIGVSQDLIVTKSNDSISCKITRVKKKTIYFVYENKSDYRSTLLPINEVQTYSYDFFEKKIPKEKIPGFSNRQKFRVAVSGGYSYEPIRVQQNISPELRDYFKKLRSGSHVEGSITYYFDDFIGLGAIGNLYKTSNSLNNAQGSGFSIVSDDISVSFLGAILSLKYQGKNKKGILLLNTRIGQMSYENLQRINSSMKLTGRAFAGGSNICYDRLLNNNLALGMEIGVMSGFFKNLESENSGTIEYQNRDRPFGAARFDFSIGLRYYL